MEPLIHSLKTIHGYLTFPLECPTSGSRDRCLDCIGRELAALAGRNGCVVVIACDEACIEQAAALLRQPGAEVTGISPLNLNLFT